MFYLFTTQYINVVPKSENAAILKNPKVPNFASSRLPLIRREARLITRWRIPKMKLYFSTKRDCRHYFKWPFLVCKVAPPIYNSTQVKLSIDQRTYSYLSSKTLVIVKYVVCNLI